MPCLLLMMFCHVRVSLLQAFAIVSMTDLEHDNIIFFSISPLEALDIKRILY